MMKQEEPNRYYDWMGWKLKQERKKIMKDEHEEIENAEMVYNPPHYNQSKIECIDAIESATENGFENYLQGNIIKYIWRYRYKNGLQDLKKAEWYLNKLISITKNKYD